MKAIIVSVDYGPQLSVTLPYNRHHFDEVLVVSAARDSDTARVAAENDARLFLTDAFWDNGADFNKWKALEQGLDRLGRDGWICLIDADILWPRRAKLPSLEVGRLYGPRRLLCPVVPPPIPDESLWTIFGEHPCQDFSGFTQVFHASDPVLPAPPWHEQDWRHAGGADTHFNRLWARSKRTRLQWDVLHVGQPGVNWCGVGNEKELHRYMRMRRSEGSYRAERL